MPENIELYTSALIPNFDGEILLVRSEFFDNKWILPGGKVIPGRPLVSSCEHLILQKTSLSVVCTEVVSFGESFYRDRHFIGFDLLCNPVLCQPKIPVKYYSHYMWQKPEDALNLPLGLRYSQGIEDYLNYLRTGWGCRKCSD